MLKENKRYTNIDLLHSFKTLKYCITQPFGMSIHNTKLLGKFEPKLKKFYFSILLYIERQNQLNYFYWN